MEEKLDLLGRLMGCARQRDMLMADDAIVDWYAAAFLAENYKFEGEPVQNLENTETAATSYLT